jgi:predicted dinucleotide-binding enzyme
MKIGILGAGSVGQKLAVLAQVAGHQVAVGLRDSTKASTDAPWRWASLAEAGDFGEIVVIAIPYLACAEVLPNLRESLAGKIVIDTSNPLNQDWSPVLLGQETSAGEQVKQLLPQSHVVKAFNTVFADIMTEERIVRGDQAATVFVCGDDAVSRAVVCAFAESLNFAPVNAGPLLCSRYLEGMAHLNIQLAVVQGGGTNAAFLYHRIKS